MAVVFSVMTSYFLSRTLVPTMVHYLLAAEIDLYSGEGDSHTKKRDIVWRVHERFNVHFERFRRLLRRLSRLGARSQRGS